MRDLKECLTCEATGYVYVGFGEHDVKECTECKYGYIEQKTITRGNSNE